MSFFIDSNSGKTEEIKAKQIPVETTSGFNDENSTKLIKNKRLHLKTDERWVASEGHLSDLIILQWLSREDAVGAKPALVWQDENGDDKTAIITHDKANNPAFRPHRHISIETTMSPSGQYPDELFTRLELPYDQDVCEIQTHSSNFSVNGGMLRVANENGVNKEIVFCRSYSSNTSENLDINNNPIYEKVYNKRWSIRADNTAESSTKSGADFKITRFDNNGVALDSPIVIKRDTGFTGLGVSDPQRQLDVAGDRIRIRNTKTPASATDTGLKGDICYDANYVYICVADNTWKRSALSAW